MVHGSWLKDGWGPGRSPGPPRAGGGGGRGGRRPRAPAGPCSHPWAMSHEPSTITDRLINELFDYILVRTGPKNPDHENVKLWSLP